MKLIILFVVVGIIFLQYATPSFHLRAGVGEDTQNVVTEKLGKPLQTVDNLDGSSVWTFKTEKIPYLCVEYIVTFAPKTASEDTTQPPPSEQPARLVLSKWTWRWCPAAKQG